MNYALGQEKDVGNEETCYYRNSQKDEEGKHECYSRWVSRDPEGRLLLNEKHRHTCDSNYEDIRPACEDIGIP